ncbi:hypothetical protein M011DRAFT_276419 [Sporormia fimetaria CBS 119925]|uniref:Cep57 centrosome microtubule-binding domain-containing protein n=1 Tax=Sporormia fimetaria CBS 119925 TaxID=1340428 RepID=A0A6A6VKQ3_9PLEO|nr:hypothetical protein M011DRAFT_276419 [Sporormia fimetaria CBS 119925]
MQSSPPKSEGKARAIRELSRSMNGHSTRSIPSPSPPPTDSNPTQQLDASFSFNNDDILMSTQQRIEDDTNTLPHYRGIRSTAKKVGRWQMPRVEPRIETSVVNKEFLDFDQSGMEEDDVSIEQGRGVTRSSRGTPGRHNSSFDAFNSLYGMTPPSARTRKSNNADAGNLRRDAQIRLASRNDLDTASPRPANMRNSPAISNKIERKRTSLAQSHAKVSEDESSFIEERPPTLTFPNRSTRWAGQRSRQNSQQFEAAADTGSRQNDTGRSRPATAQTGTGQSFMLPDLPNLTELVSGVFEDGTPMFSKTTPARSRIVASKARARRQPNHIPVDSVPIPDEEKAIFAALQLLQERVAHLEHERVEHEKKIEEQDLEIIELRASQRAQDTTCQLEADSVARGSWKVEKTRLEASVQTLQKKLERSDRKLSVANIEKNRLQKERDNMATQLAVAYQNFEELKSEKEALSSENETLRQEVDSLRSENDVLRDELEREQQQYRDETLQLRRQVDRTDDVTRREAESLRAELNRIRARHDENTQQLARKESELRKARKEQAEYAKLKSDNDLLREQLSELKRKREQEMRRWVNREQELKGRIERRDETIRHFEDMTQEQTNEAIRHDNENLRQELAHLSAQHDEDLSNWQRREAQLKRRVNAAKEKEALTQEVLDMRQPNDRPTLPRRPSQRREDTRTRIAHQVQQEVRNNKPTGVSEKSFSGVTAFNRRTLPVHPSRSVSAPITIQKHAEVDSDVESTTDLSLAPRSTPYKKPSTSAVQPPAPLDLTELSYIDAEQIAQLRRALEEERAGLRGRETPAARQTREDTVRSSVSMKSARPRSLPRKSSMKNMTERTTGTVFEDLTGHVSNRDAEPTQTDNTGGDLSVLSNTSRRRRSMPTENMTSAFIVPDITMNIKKDGTTKIKNLQNVESRSHDNENCTVCRRNTSNPSDEPVKVPKLVPVSSRMPDEPDATMRPSQSPKDALALVVKELLDERAHLHLELAACRAMLEAHDVSMGMKKRTKINEAMKDILRLIETKDTQIYHLYDVLEGQDRDITEQDVEELTREIRFDEQATSTSQQKKKGKKVTVRSFHESDEGDTHLTADEDELPWEGFEETATHSINFGGFDARSKEKAFVDAVGA